MGSPSSSVAPGTASRLTEIAAEVDRRMAAELAARSSELLAVGPELDLALTAVHRAVAGGKRLRPAFCYWGYAAVRSDVGQPAYGMGAALELLHGAALVHDDLMDDSDTRRGGPSAHRWLQEQTGDERFGHNAAVLLGDLLLTWADAVFRDAVATAGDTDAAAHLRALRLFDTLRVEVTAGQFLDVFSQTRPLDDADGPDRAERVLRFKSAGYSIQRPLQIGAALAGGDEDLIRGLGDVGLPLGVAFQLRDDLLGVFGDPARTGKPVGDDLREGKRTVLLAEALARLPADDAAALRRGVGDASADADDISRLTGLIERSGAVAAVEERITASTREADAALAALDLAPESRAALTELAVLATQRTA